MRTQASHLTTSHAWLMAAGGVMVFARGQSGTEDPFASPVTRLIYGINEDFGEERFRLLRTRIYTDHPLTTWDQSLVKVCGKRISPSATFETAITTANRVIDCGKDPIAGKNSSRCQELLGTALAHDDGIQLVTSLTAAETRAYEGTKRHQAPRAVAAALVDKDGKLLGAAVNSNARCQMLHAELNLLLNLAKQGISRVPDGATLYTSLKPCRMCASLILALASATPEGVPPRIKIISAEDDKGSFGRHRLLDGLLTITGSRYTPGAHHHSH